MVFPNKAWGLRGLNNLLKKLLNWPDGYRWSGNIESISLVFLFCNIRTWTVYKKKYVIWL